MLSASNGHNHRSRQTSYWQLSGLENADNQLFQVQSHSDFSSYAGCCLQLSTLYHHTCCYQIVCQPRWEQTWLNNSIVNRNNIWVRTWMRPDKISPCKSKKRGKGEEWKGWSNPAHPRNSQWPIKNHLSAHYSLTETIEWLGKRQVGCY